MDDEEESILRKLGEVRQEQAEHLKREANKTDLKKIKGPSWDTWLESVKNEPDPLDIGLRLPKEGLFEAEPLMIPAVGLSGVFACTGHCKSTFLLNVAAHLLKTGKSVVYYSYEEHRSRIYQKLALIFGYGADEPVNKNPLRTIQGYLKTGTLGNMVKDGDCFGGHREAMDRGIDTLKGYLEKEDLIVSSSDEREPNASEFAEDVKVLAEFKRPALILVDYLQLMNAGGEDKGANRQYEMKEICQELRRVTNETKIPILLAGQFNRQADVNEEYLELSKIGEAGDIERVLSFAIGLWNHNRPRKDKAEGGSKDEEKNKDHLTVKVLKNREGGTPRPFMLKTQLANCYIDFKGIKTGQEAQKSTASNKTTPQEKEQYDNDVEDML